MGPGYDGKCLYRPLSRATRRLIVSGHTRLSTKDLLQPMKRAPSIPTKACSTLVDTKNIVLPEKSKPPGHHNLSGWCRRVAVETTVADARPTGGDTGACRGFLLNSQ